jgi:hypothetical protein
VWARPVVGDRAAVVLVWVWSPLPSAVVLSMAYSEVLFVAAAAGCLLGLQRRRWLLAAAAATVGGLTRPTGGALVLAVWVAVAVEMPRSREPAITAWAAVTLAPVGLVVSLAHVAHATGRLDGWFWLERTVWRSGFDGGRSGLDKLGQLVTGGTPAHRLPEIVAAALVLAAIALAVRLFSARPRPAAPAAA